MVFKVLRIYDTYVKLDDVKLYCWGGKLYLQIKFNAVF